MNYPISLCYHPTKIIFVDDNIEYTEHLIFKLEKYYSFHSFHDPVKAVKFFQENHHPNTFIQQCSIKLDEREAEDIPREHLAFSEIDLKLICKEIDRVERYQEIAVAVVDYAMPKMNGLALSRQLKALYPMLRILLLTGEADEELAIKAFNEGIIDQYIKKSTPDLTKHLLDTIKKLEHLYFLSLSKLIIDQASIILEQNKLLRLYEPKLIDVFNHFFNKYQINEYYLIDNTGSFILIDKEGNPYWFVLQNAEEMRVNSYHADCSEDVPQSVLDALKNKQKLLFFFTDKDAKTNAYDWEPYLHAVTEIKGAETYYYAFIQQPSPYQWDVSNIVTYKDYLNSLN